MPIPCLFSLNENELIAPTSFTLSHRVQSNFVYNVTLGAPSSSYIGPVTLRRLLPPPSPSIDDASMVDNDETIILGLLVGIR
jgi:hypothetical protein